MAGREVIIRLISPAGAGVGTELGKNTNGGPLDKDWVTRHLMTTRHSVARYSVTWALGR